jgi:hypothetical protein
MISSFPLFSVEFPAYSQQEARDLAAVPRVLCLSIGYVRIYYAEKRNTEDRER